ncbi:hypothetical protein KSD_34050 [Ktedonobacter sp. SOSP1-85]|nr:hypothetical protein KSD_34050 [Ktedonobacter sp. SOSP1-85]
MPGVHAQFICDGDEANTSSCEPAASGFDHLVDFFYNTHNRFLRKSRYCLLGNLSARPLCPPNGGSASHESDVGFRIRTNINYFSENPEREALDTPVALGFGIRSKYIP